MIPMLIPASASASNMSAATPGCVRMPAPTSEIFAISGSCASPRAPISRRERLEHLHGAPHLRLRERERDVRVPFRRDVLDDHVHVHAHVGERAEDAGGDPGPVGHGEDRHLRLRRVVRDPRDDRLLHQLLLTDDPRSLVLRERRADVDADSMVTGELDRAQHQHLGAGRGQLEHLLVRDGVELAGLRDEARVGREDALDVGVDLARVRFERGRERDRGRVRAAAAERRHLLRGRDALEAGDEHDRALGERFVDPPRADLEHLRARVVGVGDDARLRAGERDRACGRGRGSPSPRARTRSAPRPRAACRARAGAGRARSGGRARRGRRSPRPSPRARRRRRSPPSRAATSRRATAFSRSGPSTDVPPNFWTRRPMARSYTPREWVPLLGLSAEQDHAPRLLDVRQLRDGEHDRVTDRGLHLRQSVAGRIGDRDQEIALATEADRHRGEP